MPKGYILSVGEIWERPYRVEASTEEEAIKKYKEWYKGGQSILSSTVQQYGFPEYVEDAEGDIIVLRSISEEEWRA